SGTLSIRAGIPPIITITAPVSGGTVTEGASIPVTTTTTGTVAFVKLIVNGQTVSASSQFPYQFTARVPLGGSSITLGAEADNGFGDVGVAPNVVLNVVPDTQDPRTTVTGRVLDSTFQPVAGAIGSALGRSSPPTAGDGRFTIANVPTTQGN